MIRKTLFISLLIFAAQSFAQSNTDTLVLKNKYSNGTVKLIDSDLGIMNKFIFIDLETKTPISGIVAIYGKKVIFYYITESGVPKQAIMKIKNNSTIVYELTNDSTCFIETYIKNNLKSVYTIVKSENQLNFYKYELKKKYISLKHTFPNNEKRKTEKSKVAEIPLSHRLPMDQFKLIK